MGDALRKRVFTFSQNGRSRSPEYAVVAFQLFQETRDWVKVKWCRFLLQKGGHVARAAEVFKAHKEKIREVASRYPVSNIRVFGSVLHGDDQDVSDIDLLVDPLPWAQMRGMRNRIAHGYFVMCEEYG